MKARLALASSLLMRFLRWWTTELKSCTHEIVARIAPAWSRSLRIFIDAHRLRIYSSDSTRGEAILDAPLKLSAAGLPDSLAGELSALVYRHARAQVIVSSELAFIRQLRLPVAALPHLDSAISLQLPKLLPLDRLRLLTAFEVASVDSTSALVDLACLKRSELDPVLSALTASGIRVTTLQLGDTPESTPRFRFPRSPESGRESTTRRLDRSLIATAALLGLACTALAAAQSYRAEKALAAEKEHIRVASSAALRRRQLLMGKLEPLSALASIEAAPTFAALLAELTAMIPKDTWITTLEIKDRRLRIVGVTPDSASLVKRLSSSALLNDAELRSSMSIGIGTGKDRFEIAAEIKGDSP
jgi:general secretion pathway protein L